MVGGVGWPHAFFVSQKKCRHKFCRKWGFNKTGMPKRLACGCQLRAFDMLEQSLSMDWTAEKCRAVFWEVFDIEAVGWKMLGPKG